jgi:hypothetical protein
MSDKQRNLFDDETVILEKKSRLGSGGRFKALTKKLKAKGATDPEALAAWIGRKKYGKAKMAKLSKKGRSEGVFTDDFRERLVELAGELLEWPLEIRKLNPVERKDAIRAYKAHKGMKIGGKQGYKVGDKVSYSGKPWFIYDGQAHDGSILWILISKDASTMAEMVPEDQLAKLSKKGRSESIFSDEAREHLDELRGQQMLDNSNRRKLWMNGKNLTKLRKGESCSEFEEGALEEGKYHEVEALSMYRYRGYHGQTETEFWIEDPENPGNHKYIGKGKSPMERRTDALKQHAAKFNITKPIKHVNFKDRARKQAIKGVSQVGGGDKPKTGTIKLATVGGFEEVPATVVGEYAYHKGSGTKGYTVTHVPTGHALKRGLSRHDAMTIAKRLHKTLPHPLPGIGFGQKVRDQAVLTKIKGALTKAGMTGEGVFVDDFRDRLIEIGGVYKATETA